MFWKFLLYHAALWLCPPTACLPEPNAVAVHAPPPVPTDPRLMLPKPVHPFGDGMPYPLPQVCSMPAVPKKTYLTQFRFKTGPNVGVKLASEEGASCSAHMQWQSPSGEKGIHLLTCVRGDAAGNVRLDCALKLIDQDHTQDLGLCQSLPLDKATEVVFAGPGCEPMRAEVTVREQPPAPLAMTAPVCCAPLPPLMMPVPPTVPLACPMPAPVPVSFDPLPAVQACATVPAQAACCPSGCQVCPCSAVTPTPRTVCFRFGSHNGKGFLKGQGDGPAPDLQRGSFEYGAVGKLSLSPGKTCLHVHGSDWKAYADQIEVCEDGRVVLRGKVRMMCDKLGVCATLKAEELTVEVKKGKLEKFVTK